MRDYLCDNFVYDDVQLHTQFIISRPLLLKVVEAICCIDSNYVQEPMQLVYLDCQGIEQTLHSCRSPPETEVLLFSSSGLSSIKKCTGAIRMIGYDVLYNSIYDHTRATKNTIFENLKWFVMVISVVFEIST